MEDGTKNQEVGEGRNEVACTFWQLAPSPPRRLEAYLVGKWSHICSGLGAPREHSTEDVKLGCCGEYLHSEWWNIQFSSPSLLSEYQDVDTHFWPHP